MIFAPFVVMFCAGLPVLVIATVIGVVVWAAGANERRERKLKNDHAEQRDRRRGFGVGIRASDDL